MTRRYPWSLSMEELGRLAAIPPADRAREIEWFADLADGGVIELRSGGQKIAADDRKALLERVRAGEHVELEFDARTFIQRETPNRNFVRFKASILKKLARSFAGVPFLRDHDKRSLEARGGTITASELVQDTDGDAFHMTIRAVKPWAVEGLLDGTIDRFSIGAVPTGDVVCSVHKTPIFSKCYCWPGDKVKLEGDSEVVVEFIITAAEGVETSAVNVPAVVGTGIKGVRAALEALAASAGGIVPPAPPTEATMNWKRLLALLGLSETASEDAACAALEVKLAELKTAREASSGFAALQAELGVLRASQVDHHIERLYAEGKLPIRRDDKGERIAGELETKLRNLATVVGMTAMLEVANALPVVAPIGPRAVETALGASATGGGQQGGGALPTAITPDNAIGQYANMLSINQSTLADVMAQTGVSAEDLAKYGPQAAHAAQKRGR